MENVLKLNYKHQLIVTLSMASIASDSNLLHFNSSEDAFSIDASTSRVASVSLLHKSESEDTLPSAELYPEPELELVLVEA